MFTVEINDAEVDAAFARLSAHLGDLTEVFEVLGDLLEETTEQRFDEGVSPDGIPWAPKSDATIRAYEAHGWAINFKPLFGPNLDGFPLRSSFFHDASPTQLEIGTNKIQAAVMQFGAVQGEFGATIGKNKNGREYFQTIPWGNIPARPFLGISQSDRGLILSTIGEWLEEAAED